MFCGVVFSVTYLVTCLAVALLWSKIDSLHSTRARISQSVLSTDLSSRLHSTRARISPSIEQYHAFYTSEYKSPFTFQT